MMAHHYDMTTSLLIKNLKNDFILFKFNLDKRASLACAAQLADIACPQSHPAGACSYSV